MNENRIAERVAKRGQQTRRKDKDLMRDTGGVSKGREREPDFKPPRDDNKNRYKDKKKPKEYKDKEVKDPDEPVKRKIKRQSDHPLADLFKPPTFEDRVRSAYHHILERARGVSEKAFRDQDELAAEVASVISSERSQALIEHYRENRPEFIAEVIYGYENDQFGEIEGVTARVAGLFLRKAAAKGLRDIEEGMTVHISPMGSGEIIELRQNGKEIGHVKTSYYARNYVWVVTNSYARGGWGPFLYDIAMERAGSDGLTADRGETSPSATSLWRHYLKRGDVESKYMPDWGIYEGLSFRSDYGEEDSPLDYVFFRKNKNIIKSLKSMGILR